MISHLTRSSVLWSLFGLQVLIWIGFVLIMSTYDFVLIDEMWEPEAIRVYIGELSQEQKQAHMWTTASLDVLYPLAYGAFYIGVTMRVFERFGRWLILPAVAVIPIDLTEGVVQVLALNGQMDVIWHKVWVTPWKLGLFIAASVIALAALAVLLKRKFLPTTGA